MKFTLGKVILLFTILILIVESIIASPVPKRKRAKKSTKSSKKCPGGKKNCKSSLKLVKHKGHQLNIPNFSDTEVLPAFDFPLTSTFPNNHSKNRSKNRHPKASKPVEIPAEDVPNEAPVETVPAETPVETETITQEAPQPTAEPTAEPTPEPTVTHSSTKAPAPTTTEAPQPTKEPVASSTGGSGSRSGEGTYYNPGLGACGQTDGDNDAVVAMAAPDFDPSTPNGNPNKNSLCGKQIRIYHEGKSATATIQDRCPECKSGDVDMAPVVFNQLADPSKGRISITWSYI
ncbi:hypothetical protein G9A89_012577 [Geosiphon pyriformis]|nr:hypothetical protein G9A89_012577 [Geosiphon pyriformis]